MVVPPFRRRLKAMKSGWVDRDADAIVADGAKVGVERDLSLRIYTTRLLGCDPRLVLHGGGNTSLKTTMRDRFGEDVAVMRVKASGADMATITPDGLPAVRLEPMRKLRMFDSIDDAELVAIERANLIEPRAPNPSVEMMLHAFLPHKFVDHTHANAVLSLIDQSRGEEICTEAFDGRMAFVPYLMPGFGLAKKAIEVFERAPDCEGLVLSKHGLVTFGETAREAYERMIAFVSRAEDFIARNRKSIAARAAPTKTVPLARVAPIIRGACSEPETREGSWRRLVLEFRTNDAILEFLNGKDLQRLSESGVITPDHTIRTKNWPLLLVAPQSESFSAFAQATRHATQAFTTRYRDYFVRHNKRFGGGKKPLDPLPRVVLVPELGLFGLGRSKPDAVIAADIAEAWAQCLRDAEAIGRFESISEADMFDCEYWPLERAKLDARKESPLAGQVVAITGAAGAIGVATAKAFAGAGAELALLDVDNAAAREQAKALSGHALALGCDVTDAGSVSAAFDKIAEYFGGIDIVVSNAGAAWQGRIGEVDEDILQQSFELNFYGHQRVAQAAVRIMRAQGTGGCLLFNISKQAVNPGPDFGPYGIPKAATLALMRQYALDYGGEGIRANAVNADRIRSGLLTEEMIASRAKARGVSEKDYMTGNLLGREVTAEDVAQAFLHQALELKTTADVTTVDGGNIAAAMR
jgi:rhamnose utilization protein RhaD (predicted bifunctional aldolase and dehydrogenase)/NAD(P)-dependent dehydrogenase (short-subunit alcohol dehydrogenase family)